MSRLRGILVLNHLNESAGGANRSMKELCEAVNDLEIDFRPVAFGGGLVRRLIQILDLAKTLTRAHFLLFNSSAAVARVDPGPVLWLCRLFRCPVFVYVRESGYQYRNKYRVGDNNVRAGRLRRVYTSRHVAFLFVSEFARRGFIECFSSPSRSAVVGNGVNVPGYLKTLVSDRDEAPDLPWVVNIGTVQELKGYRLFIEVAERVCGRNPDAVFLWLGNGPDLAVARRLAGQTGFGDRIQFPGYAADPLPLLWMARVALVTSEEESFSRVAAETLAVGTKLIVCSGVGGPEEIAGAFALRVDRTDGAAAARLVNDALASPMSSNDRRRQRRHFEENFSVDVHAKRFAAALRSILRA